MINFIDIIEQYNIICNNDLFTEKILNKYNIKNSDEKKNFYIGINNNLKNRENILLLGDENFIKKNNNHYCLSEINKIYYKNKYNIDCEIIYFDIDLNENPDKNISFFINNSDSNHIYNNYINESENIFSDIKNLKLLAFNKIDYIYDPFINIAITSGINYQFINFIYLLFLDTLNYFKIKFNNLHNKYYHYRKYFYLIFKMINLINKINNNYYKLSTDLIKFSTNSDDPFIYISDDYDFLKEIPDNNGILKIFINDDLILKKIDKNFIAINSYFFNNNRDNILISKTNNYNFIITNKKDYQYINQYVNIYKKYDIRLKIKFFSDCDLPIKCKKLSEFKIENNSKIFYSSDYRFDFNKLILKNVEFKEISKFSVLVSSTQYPGYGGAATNAYNIIKKFQKEKNMIVSGLFIHNDNNIKEKCNPDNLPNIFGGLYSEMNSDYFYYYYLSKINTTPDIAFCKNCMSPNIIKRLFPNCIIIFLVSGIMGFRSLENGANQIKNFNRYKKKQEIDSINNSQLILCNSDLTISYFNKIYEDLKNLYLKPIDTTKYNVSNIKPYKSIDRSIDITIIVSNVERPVKNAKFFQKILNTNILSKYNIKIIGNNADELFKKYNVDISPLITQQEVIDILKDTKIIIIPSLFDSNSNTFREAVFCGVLPFISINVASPRKYPKYFIINNYNPEEWANKINKTLINFKEIYKKYSLTKYFKNNDNLLDFIY